MNFMSFSLNKSLLGNAQGGGRVAARDPELTLPKLHGTVSICSQGKQSGDIPVLQAEYNKVLSLNSIHVDLVVCA